MVKRRDPSLHRLFFTGLALAGASCSPYRSAPPDTTPRQSPPTASGAITDPAAVEAAKLYTSADPAKALPGLELVGMVEDPGLVDTDPTCSKMPCDAEWLKLAHMGGQHVVIMRRNGKLEALTEFNFKEVLGPLDTPEKIALRMQVDDYAPPATCGRLAAQGLACADGSNDAHVPVRAVDGAFEVVTFSERNVCENNQHGNATVLGVMKVDAEGELSPVDNALSNAAAAQVLPSVQCHYPSRGRMFEGFEPSPLERCELEYFVRAAREEAAAVLAFERLERELAQHGAPAELIESARQSAEDERRHAMLFRREAVRLAEALGVPIDAGSTDLEQSFAERSLFEMLVENAHEGCANETYAALVATHQAEHARDGRLGAMFASIAADERDHAILAYRVHAWGGAKLDAAARAELAAVFDQACARVLTGQSSPLASAMGEPPPAQTREAFRHVVGALRAAA